MVMHTRTKLDTFSLINDDPSRIRSHGVLDWCCRSRFIESSESTNTGERRVNIPARTHPTAKTTSVPTTPATAVAAFTW